MKFLSEFWSALSVARAYHRVEDLSQEPQRTGQRSLVDGLGDGEREGLHFKLGVVSFVPLLQRLGLLHGRGHDADEQGSVLFGRYGGVMLIRRLVRAIDYWTKEAKILNFNKWN